MKLDKLGVFRVIAATRGHEGLLQPYLVSNLANVFNTEDLNQGTMSSTTIDVGEEYTRRVSQKEAKALLTGNEQAASLASYDKAIKQDNLTVLGISASVIKNYDNSSSHRQRN